MSGVRVSVGVILTITLFCAGCQERKRPSATESNVAAPRSEADAPAPEIDTAAGIPMVLIPAGEFVMGGGQEPDSAFVRTVRVDAFYMDRFEVTQAVYEQLMGKNPSRHVGAKHPVERMRWTDAIQFCNRRSEEEGLTPCYDVGTWTCDFAADGYRLPTEAEWEYACRAQSTGDFYFPGGSEQLERHAWFRANARRRHQPVGQKLPNAFELHDMLGNVREWCNDWYAVDYYAQGPESNPRGPAEGEKAVLRGGAFSTTAESCTNWARYCDEPGFTDACVASDDYGFRCVRGLTATTITRATSQGRHVVQERPLIVSMRILATCLIPSHSRFAPWPVANGRLAPQFNASGSQ